MNYLRRIPVPEIGNKAELSEETAEAKEAVLYVTDDIDVAKELKGCGKAVLIYLHDGNRDQDFSEFLYAVEDPDGLDLEFVEKVYRRLRGMPWDILETERCLIRETTPEDVDDFYHIYSDPAITRYMEDLYPEIDREKQYIREYIEKVYSFFEFGVWTVVERESGSVIGRAGFAFREGYEEPELGFIIGVPWQRQGYAEEVCRAVMKYGWEILGFQRVQAMVEPENTASLKLCGKLGFVEIETVTEKEKAYIRLIASVENNEI